MAHAGAEFAGKILRVVKGEEIILQSYVSIDACTEGEKVALEEPNGIEKIPLIELNEYEKGVSKAANPELQYSIRV